MDTVTLPHLFAVRVARDLRRLLLRSVGNVNGLQRHGTGRYSTAWHGMARDGTAAYGTVRHNKHINDTNNNICDKITQSNRTEKQSGQLAYHPTVHTYIHPPAPKARFVFFIVTLGSETTSPGSTVSNGSLLPKRLPIIEKHKTQTHTHIHPQHIVHATVVNPHRPMTPTLPN